jgi:hypothetical protein
LRGPEGAPVAFRRRQKNWTKAKKFQGASKKIFEPGVYALRLAGSVAGGLVAWWLLKLVAGEGSGWRN